ncbi:MAG TPA: phosphotransferase [Kofleriaceae bacterium]|nr:phosphotransferase [Kofleriaceae bacterium]
MTNLEACLPADLQGPTTTITRVAAGMSGAGVYRVEVAGQAYVLKVVAESEPIERWRRRVHIHRLAADAGVAPRIVHVDEARRAVVSAFVGGTPFPAVYGDPRTREDVLALLGRTVRRVHEIPLPPDADVLEPRTFLGTIWSALVPGFPVPAFVEGAVARALAEAVPACERPAVLSHNDANPTNVVYDGEHLLFIDWDTAGSNDPFYDLAAIAVFLRMDDATCQRLLAAHDGAPVDALPARFVYNRRLIAVMCGTASLYVARTKGHAGATGQETLESSASLEEFYRQMRSGSISITTPEGQWCFGLALVKASTTL